MWLRKGRKMKENIQTLSRNTASLIGYPFPNAIVEPQPRVYMSVNRKGQKLL